MKIENITRSIGTAVVTVTLWTGTGHAHEPERKAAAVSQEPGEPDLHETVRPVFQRAIPNVPSRSMIAVVVSYPPGAKSAVHRHAASAFIYAHVLSGAIRSQVDDQPAKVYHAGEGFYEDPGAQHRVSENASANEPASLLAVFVVDPTENPLTIPERK
ncbi:cupin domain-containing protein (plasmid) [Microvirga terrae]|uniref:Cupin domain-containing protein n=1 Tax=Microvirga terrae TaxID=2740529 RepID=A0ABY5RZD8_9HYPH|nr:cupin domain-containing protein [Microvirga terrae]UVF22623.1 cupin domain-containing protein [Microvirga terrae]